jgi:hypothetical protein
MLGWCRKRRDFVLWVVGIVDLQRLERRHLTTVAPAYVGTSVA